MRNLIIAAIVLVSMVFSFGCEANHEEATRILESEGLHDIRLLGWTAFSCSKEDSFNVEFSAQRTVMAANGTTSEIEVNGVVCCGLMKSCTIRH
jgi:hypothetical protein